LRPKQHEVHDDENENERDEKPDAAGRTWSRRGGLCLSQKQKQHAENLGEPELKPERFGCNRESLL
jgi:hypothetical protein